MMGLREWWGRLIGDRDRLEREEEAIRDAGSEPPAPLEDYEASRDDLVAREYDLPAADTAIEEERDGPA